MRSSEREDKKLKDFDKRNKEQEELVEMIKQQEQLKNTSIKQMVRNREKEAEERRKRDFAEK